MSMQCVSDVQKYARQPVTTLNHRISLFILHHAAMRRSGRKQSREQKQADLRMPAHLIRERSRGKTRRLAPARSRASPRGT